MLLAGHCDFDAHVPVAVHSASSATEDSSGDTALADKAQLIVEHLLKECPGSMTLVEGNFRPNSVLT